MADLTLQALPHVQQVNSSIRRRNEQTSSTYPLLYVRIWLPSGIYNIMTTITATHSYNNTNSYNTTNTTINNLTITPDTSYNTHRVVTQKYQLDLQQRFQEAMRALLYMLLMQTLYKNQMFDMLGAVKYHRSIDWRA